MAALIGCAVATGVGTVLRTAAVRAEESPVGLGCGRVGQAVLLGLRLVSAYPPVAVDTVEGRLEQARRLGASHWLRGDDPDLEASHGRLPIDLLIGRRAPLSDADRALADLRAAAGLRTILEPEAA